MTHSISNFSVAGEMMSTDTVERRDAALAEAVAIENIPDRSNLSRMIALIAMGLFITSTGQPGVIGRLPFQHLFKNEMGFNATDVAAFWAIANFAWYFKPFAGILCDSIPIFGTRRKWYLILSALAAGALWLVYGILPHTKAAFLWNTVFIAGFMVIASTVVGGLLVEQGQKHGMTGRLTSMRFALEGIMALIVGPLGGYLATKALGVTYGLGAFLLFSLVPTAFFFIREGRGARVDTDVLRNAARQLRASLASRTMWAAAGLIFLVHLAPGFSTALYFYQTDRLKFDDQFIGYLGMLSGIGSIIGAVIYGVLCKKISLRPLLMLGVIFNVTSTLFYLMYKTREAALVLEFANGLFATLAVLPLYDLAARATPKGSESFGYALMMSVRNLTLFAVSDVIGSYIYEHNGHNFTQLVGINAATTFIVLFAIPFLPRVLMDKTDR
jgi:hypothetical protein